MEVLENLLHSFNTNFVNSVILFLMVVVFVAGLWFTKKDKQTEFVHYVPTLLTTMGIFGTFLGIVLGLLDFDQSNIESSIAPLLAGLKTAFITSLVGIFSSLIFKTLSTFSFLKPIQDENTIEHATPEAILQAMNDQVAEIKTLKSAIVGDQETTLFEQVQVLSEDINNHSKATLERAQEQEALQHKMFDEFSVKLWEQLENFADTLSKSATKQVIDALRHVIADFNHNLTEQFGDNFKQLNQAVARLLQWQENYKVQLEGMNSQYAQGIESLAATELSITNISEQSKAIPETMVKLKDVMEINQHQLNELEIHLEAFKVMSEKATEALPQMNKQVEDTIKDISAAVKTANEHHNTLLEESDSYIQKHAKTSNDLLEKFSSEAEKGINSVATHLVDSSEVMSKNIEQAASQFASSTGNTNESLHTSSSHLQDALKGLNSTMSDMIKALVSDAKEMTTTMQTANQNLITDTEQVRTTVVQSSEKLQQKLEQVIDEVAIQQINQAKRTFDAMEDQIKQQGGVAGEVVDTQLKLIDTAMQKEINRVMSEMGLALAQVSGKFVEDYIKLTKAMDEIVNQRVL